MPPTLDVYVVSKHRDHATIDRFVQDWVDRQSSEDRGDEELMLLPLGTTQVPDGADGWEWEPARTLSHVILRGLLKPSRAFAVYLRPLDPTLDGAVLGFTTDDLVVFGLSADDSTESEENFITAKAILQKLARDVAADFGYIGWEVPPPLTAATALSDPFSRLLFTWTPQ